MHENKATRNLWRSTAAVVAGLIAIVVTHTGTDHVMHTTGVFPPYGEPMTDSGQYALALGYRIVFSVVGCYLTAVLAPRNPMRHALVLGGIGVVLSTAGAVMMWDMGPGWYPISLIIIALPSAWSGGKLHQVVHERREPLTE
jgi:hypothetical protein